MNFFKKKSSQTIHSIEGKSTIQEYYSLRQQLQIPLKMKMFFQMLESLSEGKDYESTKKNTKVLDAYKPFCKSFHKMPTEEKYQFLLEMGKNTYRILQRSGKISEANSYDPVFKNQKHLIEKVETCCELRSTFMGMNSWDTKLFKLQSERKVLKLFSKNAKKKQTLIHLSNYHARMSVSEKNTVVLEAIFEIWKVPEKYRQIHMYFKEKLLFKEVYQQLKILVVLSWKERLIGMLNEAEIENIIDAGGSEVPSKSAPKMLNSQAITEYLKVKEKVEHLIIHKKIRFTLFSEVRKIRIYRSKKFHNLYMAENVVNLPYEEVRKRIELINRDTNSATEPQRKLLHFQKMESFSANISAVYFKYFVKDTTHDMISIVEDNISEKEGYHKVTFKSFGKLMIKKNVDFLQINVSKLNEESKKLEDEHKTKVFVYGFINFASSGDKLSDISVIDFLLSILEHKKRTLSHNTLNESPLSKRESCQSNSSGKKSSAEDSPIKILNNTYSNDMQSSNQYEKAERQQEQNEDDEDEFQTVVGENFDSDEERQLEILNTFEAESSPTNERPRKISIKPIQAQSSVSDQIQQQDEDQQSSDNEHGRNLKEEFRSERSMHSINSENPADMSFSKEEQSINEFTYLTKKYVCSPAPISKSDTERFLSTHYFVNEWGKHDKGGMFSLNAALLEKQKQVFKSILTRMGNSLFKRTTTNFSLPVIVFKNESQLETIAKNWSMGPILLENLQSATALERMHRTIVFMISMGTIGLSLQKPFNPIVGETFEARIDNCPIYLEQIEHHPSVSTGFFVGRGFKVYGSIHPTISIRLNSVKGYSEAPLRVEFDSEGGHETEQKHIIEFSPGRMLMGGFLVGDRTFDFTDTIYHLDYKHLLIAEITFGSKKKFSKQYSKCDKNDFVWGYVYQVTAQFFQKHLKEYKQNKTRLSAASDKESKVLSEIYGCWNEKIYINGQEVFDFEKQLPCRVIREKVTLRSDSALREDMKLLDVDLEKAQDEKDRLEEIQRKDAKMRKQHAAKRKQAEKKK